MSLWYTNHFFSIMLAYAAGFLAGIIGLTNPSTGLLLWFASSALGILAVNRAARTFRGAL